MIYLIRHGKDNKDYIGGWSDISLIDKGRKKIEKNAYWIKDNLKIKKIISSDIKRAHETAEIISSILNIDYELTSLLREQNKGLLNGKLKSNLTEKERNLINYQTIDTLFPNGERLTDLYNRVKDNMEYFKNLEDDTLIITHRGVINMFYYIFNDIPLDMDKKKFNVKCGSIHEIDFNNKTIRRIK